MRTIKHPARTLISTALLLSASIVVEAQTIYWTSRSTNKIQSSTLANPSPTDLIAGLHTPNGIALDRSLDRVYWAEEGPGVIRSADLDGSQVRTLVTNLVKPDAIALDLTDRKIYWTDWGTNLLQRANTDGSAIENLLTDPAVNHLGSRIALDLVDRRVYWSSGARIRRARLDGSRPEVFMETASTILGLALDDSAATLYWIAASTDSQPTTQVWWADVHRSVIGHLPLPGTPSGTLALDAARNMIYWTEDATNTIKFGHLQRTRLAEAASVGAPFAYSFAVDAEFPTPQSSDSLDSTERMYELAFWDSIRDRSQASEYEAYVQRFPNGTFVELARTRLREVTQSQAEYQLSWITTDRRRIQSALISLGFDPGPVNGVFGNDTRSAIRDWQVATNAAASGYLNSEAAAELLSLAPSFQEDAAHPSRDITNGDAFASISAGMMHTCALRRDGTADCWPDILTDALPPPYESFIAISSGSTYTCALREDGTPACWGLDATIESTAPTREVLVAISSGGTHACGLTPDGTPVCWGDDIGGKATPPSGERLVAISSGFAHTCGLRADGTAVCWGLQDDSPWSPTDEQLISISAGFTYTCGVLADARPVCWDVFGDILSPSSTGPLTTVTVGTRHACGLQFDGYAVCWKLIDDADEALDRAVSPPSDQFVSISAGSLHTCGIRQDGTPRCWGSDDLEYRLAGLISEPHLTSDSIRSDDDHGDVPDSATDLLTSISGNIESSDDIDYFRIHLRTPTDATVYADGDLDTLGDLGRLSHDGRIVSIDRDDDGGDYLNFRIRQTLDPGTYYVRVSSFGSDTGPYIVHLVATAPLSLPTESGPQLSAGWSHSCALLRDGAPICWGPDDHMDYSAPPYERFIAIGSGWQYTCGLRQDGQPVCWGKDSYGQTLPPSNERFVALSSGYEYACGLRADGKAVCWGRNDQGQASPPSEESFVSIRTRDSHTCGLRANGIAVCWGSDALGQATPPAQERFLAIQTGRGYTCGIRDDNTPSCWGNYPAGDFFAFLSANPYVSIVHGWDYTCGIRDDTTVGCWTADESSFTPPDGQRFDVISGRASHICGITDDAGLIACWGLQSYAPAPAPQTSVLGRPSYD